MVSSKNVKLSQKRCIGTSIESSTSSSPREQIIEKGEEVEKPKYKNNLQHYKSNKRAFFCRSIFKT